MTLLIWRRAWQPTSVFFPGESCGQSKELDTAEQLIFLTGTPKAKARDTACYGEAGGYRSKPTAARFSYFFGEGRDLEFYIKSPRLLEGQLKKNQSI